MRGMVVLPCLFWVVSGLGVIVTRVLLFISSGILKASPVSEGKRKPAIAFVPLTLPPPLFSYKAWDIVGEQTAAAAGLAFARFER